MSSTDRGGQQASPRPTLASLDARLREVEEQLAQLLARHAAEDAAAASRVFPNARGPKPGRFRVAHGDFDRSDLTLHQVGELLARLVQPLEYMDETGDDDADEEEGEMEAEVTLEDEAVEAA